ncbi:MAG TPA: hypothetical protein GX743_05400 [Actinomycetales bacterium]|nr:hypothetical protein [Actinomycetales bacterium]
MRRRLIPAGVLALALLSGCSGETEDPPVTTPAPQTTLPPEPSPTPEPTTSPEARAEEEGYASVVEYYRLFDTVRQYSYLNEAANTQLLDFVGAAFRQEVDRYLSNARFQGWGQQGTTTLSLIGLQSFVEEATYSQAVIRVCVDSSEVVGLVDGEPVEGTVNPYPLDYIVSFPAADGAIPRVDGEQIVEDATC